MPQRGTGDPLLKGADWARLRAHWRSLRQPCARCGRDIDYRIGARGPDAFDLGHIVSRDEAHALGWTRQQTNSMANTQPECRECNRSQGAIYGNTKRGRGWARPGPIEADEW